MPLSGDALKTNPPGQRMPNSAGMVSPLTIATNVLVHTVSPGTTLATAAPRRAKIRKIMYHNRGLAQVFLFFGDTSTGLIAGVFTQRLPGIQVPAGSAGTLTEEDIPNYEFNATNQIHVQVSATILNGCDVACEIEEL